MNCTSEAYFIKENSLDKIFVKGLKIGCLPSESFLFFNSRMFFMILNVLKFN